MIERMSKRTVNILLTGFERFARFAKNPSEVLVMDYDARRLEGIVGTKVHMMKLILPVHIDAFRELKRKVGRRRFDIIIHVGLLSRAKSLRIETKARNLLDFKVPDNLGNVIQKRKIANGAPTYLHSNLPVRAIIKNLKKKRTRFELSDNAGTYICNLIFYDSLLADQKRKDRTLIGFIHVPQFRKYSMKRSLVALDAVLEECIQQVLRTSQRPERRNAKGRV